MIVLDTNLVSEAMKPEPHPAVRAWLNNQAAETLYLSSVTLAELLFGIAALPTGKRKDMLAQTLDGLMGLFRDRVLPFDIDAARRYGELAAKAQAGGREIDFRVIGSGKMGSVTRQIQQAYQAAIHGNTTKYTGWLTSVK